jgi:anaerobic selenocysteine-containing dehydrogenase
MSDTSFMPAVSRRRFITGAAATVAAGALIGAGSTLTGCGESSSTTTTADTNDTIFKGACRGNCAGGCFLDIHVRNGQVVRTTAADFPNTAYNRICARGMTQVARLYSSQRLQYPMKRSDGAQRGDGKFTRISWDEAIQTIVQKYQDNIKQYGYNSNALMLGSGNYAILSGQGGASTTPYFQSILGMSGVSINVDAAAGYAYAHITGMPITGGANEPTDWKNAKTFVCWGACPTISQPHVMHFIFDAQEAGCKFIDIDTVYGANSAHADTFIPVYPSTDGALAFGVINHILSNNWVDTDFMMMHTEAPYLIKADGKLMKGSDIGIAATKAKDPTTGLDTVVDPYVVYDDASKKAILCTAITASSKPRLQKVPAVKGMKVTTEYEKLVAAAAPYTDAQVTKLTGVPAATIQELARVYHEDGPVTTYCMLGDDHYRNGHYNYWSLMAISALTGNFGKPGAACGFMEMLAAYMANSAELYATVGANGKPPQGAGPTYNINQMQNILEKGMNGNAKIPTPIKSLYITNANPVTNMANHNQVVTWMKELDFVVVSDMSMTETAKYADILLPAAHWFEQEDLFNAFSDQPYMILQDKCVDPIGEAKTDYEIYKLIAEGMGYKGFFDRTPEEWIKTCVSGPACQAAGLTFDDLKKNHVLNQLANDGGETFIAFKDGAFTTTSGKFQLYRDTVVPTYDVGQKYDLSHEYGPYWEPSAYADPASAARTGKYPYYVLSEHMRTRTHTQWWDVDYLKEYEAKPVCRMNPADAAELGVADGDDVKLSNQFGDVTLTVCISAGVPAKSVGVPRSFQQHAFKEGHFGAISDNTFNQIVANQAFNDVAVAITKA